MPEQLTKLRPDRDLQCYFQMPSAVAALSQASASGFTVSGCWRDPFDWAIVEWNRDNVFEHPALRNLPDGDLSGVRLSYLEARTGCIPMDSTLYPTVEWPFLRVWAQSGGVERLYDVPLYDSRLGYASPAVGEFGSATTTFELKGTITGGDYIELAWLDQHFNYLLTANDTLQSSVAALGDAINRYGDGTVTASVDGAQITLAYAATTGVNANRIGAYATVHGAATEAWSPGSALFHGGSSPSQWRVSLDFSSLQGYADPDRTQLVAVPTNNVRKMRWTWAADLQVHDFQRIEFSVVVSDWSVTGTNLTYRVAGPGSRRIEDDSTFVEYSAADQWGVEVGNYSGGSIHWTTTPGAYVRSSYTTGSNHTLYLGTRCMGAGGHVTVQVDGQCIPVSLALPNEDVLVRVSLGQLAGGVSHAVKITHDGAAGSYFYFDFLEIAFPSADLPGFAEMPATTLATDWDTNHSIALAPERTAWLMQKLGFRGRANHYAGALWFYELCRPGQEHASATITFSGNPEWGQTTSLAIDGTPIQHTNLIGDTAETVALCFALLINAGSNSAWAQAAGATLTVTARRMGTSGNGLSISANAVNTQNNSTPLIASASAATLGGGNDGTRADPNGNYWRTDLTATPRINRAARDWSQSFFRALKSYGIDATASFSMELQHGDDTAATGIAQRYPNGDPAWLTTPALQTNFGPESTAFWRQVYMGMAGLMLGAGTVPYLQFGEVQWWYFPGPTATAVTEPGLALYDAFTTTTFQACHGRLMELIVNRDADPAAYSAECQFLSGLIGAFTSTIRDFVRSSYPSTRFEVLYPVDVNDTPMNQAINFPANDWTPANLNCLKTENFTYTFERDLNKAAKSIQFPAPHGFAPSQASHLVGISDPATPWQREQQTASGGGLESVVLFALDQFCLIGYRLPIPRSVRRGRFMGPQ